MCLSVRDLKDTNRLVRNFNRFKFYKALDFRVDEDSQEITAVTPFMGHVIDSVELDSGISSASALVSKKYGWRYEAERGIHFYAIEENKDVRYMLKNRMYNENGAFVKVDVEKKNIGLASVNGSGIYHVVATKIKLNKSSLKAALDRIKREYISEDLAAEKENLEYDIDTAESDVNNALLDIEDSKEAIKLAQQDLIYAKQRVVDSKNELKRLQKELERLDKTDRGLNGKFKFKLLD